MPKFTTEGGSDPYAFSDYWSLPSGQPKPSDPTMLHTLARIVFEQTGLRLTSVVTMSGTVVEPATLETGNAQRMRMLFMIEVAELGPMLLDNPPFGTDFGFGIQELDFNSVPIALNLSQHRRHVWSREEDLRDFINSGLYPIEEKVQYRMILEAFVFHKQNLVYLDSLNQQRQNAGSTLGFHIWNG